MADRLKGLTKRAKDTAAEHKDQVHQAVEKAETLADRRTGGKYHDQIQKAGAKVETYVENLPPQAGPPQAGDRAEAQSPPPAAADTGHEPGGPRPA